MAEHGAVEYATETGNDYDEHRRTYRVFLGLAKWAAIVVAVLMISMALFLV